MATKRGHRQLSAEKSMFQMQRIGARRKLAKTINKIINNKQMMTNKRIRTMDNEQ